MTDERAARVARYRAAHAAGRAAFHTRGPRRNPYHGLSPDPVERWCSVAWAAGWTADNPFRAGGPHDPFPGRLR
ncbi:MAG: hypothetical protein L0I76_32085 [Pseudonocardia sp.]|nr:hypothetical protein [Pseudonocardia sp.]